MQPGMMLPVRPDHGAMELNPSELDSVELNPVELTRAFLNEVRAQIGSKQFGYWFDGKVRVVVQDARAQVHVGSPFLMNWMERHFRGPLAKAAALLIGPAAELQFSVDANLVVCPAAMAAVSTVEAGSASASANPIALGQHGTGVAVPAISSSAQGQNNDWLTTVPGQMTSQLDAILKATGADFVAHKVVVYPDGKSWADSPKTQSISNQSAELLPGTAVAATTPVVSAPKSVLKRTSSGANGNLPSETRRRKYADLGEFVVSESTGMAFSAAMRLARGEALPFQTLYLYGAVGTGKTHLLEGIYKEIRQSRPQANVLLLTAETFANLFTQALQEKTLASFRHKFRSVDVLLIDDVDFLDATKVIREEFLHRFSDLLENGRQIVLTSDRHPRLLTRLGDELVSRFLSGALCRVGSPDSETRSKIVTEYSAKLNVKLADDTRRYITQRFTSNIREVQGALNCLQTFSAPGGGVVSLQKAREILGELERDCMRIVRLSDVEQAVCDVFAVKSKDLKSASRTRSLSQPRMLAMFLARKHTSSAYNEIGQHFGGRNHSTVISAEKKVQASIAAKETWSVGVHKWVLEDLVSTLEQQLLAG